MIVVAYATVTIVTAIPKIVFFGTHLGQNTTYVNSTSKFERSHGTVFTMSMVTNAELTPETQDMPLLRIRALVGHWRSRSTIAVIISLTPVLLGLLSVAACNSGRSGEEPATDVTVNALVQPTGGLYPFLLPPGVVREQAAVAGQGAVSVNDRVAVTGLVASAGTVGVGVNTTVSGNVIALGETSSTSIALRNNAHVTGDVRGQTDVSLAAGATVSGQLIKNTNLGQTTQFAIMVTYPKSTCAPVTLSQNMVISPDPGIYCSFVANPRALLKLQAGTYFVRQLDIEPTAQLIVDASNGPVVLYVADTVSIKGSIVQSGGKIGDFLIAYLGNQTVELESAMTGTIFAPFGAIDVLTGVGVTHRGAFLGNSVTVHEDSHVTLFPFTWSVLNTATLGGATMPTTGRRRTSFASVQQMQFSRRLW